MPHRLSPTRATRGRLLAGALAVAVAASACSRESDKTPPQSGEPPTTDRTATTVAGAAGELIVFSTEGGNLNAYEAEPPFEKQTVVTNAADDPETGMDLDGQICFLPDEPSLFVAGEGTGRPERTPGWGIFEVEGNAVGELAVTEVGRLVPTYQEDQEAPETFGCGVLSDGRVVTSDIGNPVEGPANGQLIIWFPPFDREEVAFCKLATDLPAAGGIAVDGDDVYVTSARAPDAGVLRFRGPFPTADDADGGCGRTDATGAPVADAVRRDAFVTADERAPTPTALVAAPDSDEDGGFFVTSASSGTIVQYDEDGAYVGTLLAPPDGEESGGPPFSTGTPLGLAVTDDGTIFFADAGLGSSSGTDGAGSLRMLAPGGSEPEVMDDGLDHPEGVGLYLPAAGGGSDPSPL